MNSQALLVLKFGGTSVSSAAKAVSYIEITTRSRRTLFGAGMHPNIITASLLAIFSAVNRAVATDALPARADKARTGT